MSTKRGVGHPQPEREEYEPPAFIVLGTIRELTQAFGAGTTDAGTFSAGIPSDRRLKIGFRPVRSDGVLARLAEGRLV